MLRLDFEADTECFAIFADAAQDAVTCSVKREGLTAMFDDMTAFCEILEHRFAAFIPLERKSRQLTGRLSVMLLSE
ncbi:hypothetical protein ACIFQM_11165 [Paenibacillus sp. NRS-1782]|uniref:hypothetical protein n=1 Tax=unclassified Paenibacillus TaxID=185978 RepID=UPI003D2D37FE